MLIDKLGSKVKDHVYILLYNDKIHSVYDNRQIAEDMINITSLPLRLEIWAVWRYRGDYNPLVEADKTEKVNYNG